MSLNSKLSWNLWIRPLFGFQVSLLSSGQDGRATHLKSSQQDAAGNGNTDLIVVVDLPFATCCETVYLFENQNQNGRCIQILLNPVGPGRRGGEERYSRDSLVLLIFVLRFYSTTLSYLHLIYIYIEKRIFVCLLVSYSYFSVQGHSIQ